MTDDYSALLRGVLLDPADDLVRLVLADCIEEGGDGERAEFIRVQVETARLKEVSTEDRGLEGCNRLYDLLGREQELAGRNEAEWAEPLCVALGHDRQPVPGLRWEFRRGFISEIRLPLVDFLSHAKELFSQHPIGGVVLTDRQPMDLSREARRGLFCWHDSEYFSEEAPDNLPGNLIAFIAEYRYEGHIMPLRQFDSLEAANAALSSACVAYGRSLAGLPPIPVRVENGGAV